MSHRTFTIPSVSALTFTLGASACAPSIMGTWELVEINGDDVEQTTTYNGCEVTYALSVEVEMDERDGDKVLGSFDQKFSYTYDCGGGYSGGGSDSYDGEVEADSDDGEEWDVEVELDDGDDFDLTCTVEDDEMDWENDDGTDFLFERG